MACPRVSGGRKLSFSGVTSSRKGQQDSWQRRRQDKLLGEGHGLWTFESTYPPPPSFHMSLMMLGGTVGVQSRQHHCRHIASVVCLTAKWLYVALQAWQGARSANHHDRLIGSHVFSEVCPLGTRPVPGTEGWVTSLEDGGGWRRRHHQCHHHTSYQVCDSSFRRHCLVGPFSSFLGGGFLRVRQYGWLQNERFVPVDGAAASVAAGRKTVVVLPRATAEPGLVGTHFWALWAAPTAAPW